MDFTVLADSGAVLFRADAVQDEVFQLFRYPIARVSHHARR